MFLSELSTCCVQEVLSEKYQTTFSTLSASKQAFSNFLTRFAIEGYQRMQHHGEKMWVQALETVVKIVG